MRARSPYRSGLPLAAVAAAGLLALTGCQLGDRDDPSSTTSTPTATASATGTSSARPTPSGKAPAKGALPDVCTLLSRAEVSGLAGGKQVVQVDPDGAAAGATTRHCQWQLSGARLAIFLSPTTAGEFTQAHGNSPSVSGVGDDAFLDSGHLYVRHGTVQIDVYATLGNDDAAGQKLAKAAALKIVERL